MNLSKNIIYIFIKSIDEERDFRELRNIQKLTLRKKAVYKKIMMHRKINEENKNNNFINIKDLDLSKYKDEVEQLISLQTGDEKLFYITTYLENNIEPHDIFSNLFFFNENEQLNDLSKYCLIFLLSLLNKDVMKQNFPNTLFKNKNIILSDDKQLIMSKKLFQIFFSILFYSKIKEIQNTLIELILNYSERSDDFIDYCLEDIRYINKLFQLTYSNMNEIIYIDLIILLFYLYLTLFLI